MNEVRIGGLSRQPEHQFIEKQHDGVVAEGLGVPANDLQAVVEFEKGFVLSVSLRAV